MTLAQFMARRWKNQFPFDKKHHRCIFSTAFFNFFAKVKILGYKNPTWYYDGQQDLTSDFCRSLKSLLQIKLLKKMKLSFLKVLNNTHCLISGVQTFKIPLEPLLVPSFVCFHFSIHCTTSVSMKKFSSLKTDVFSILQFIRLHRSWFCKFVEEMR